MSTRKGLVVGIDYYEHVSPLFGCVNDARSVDAVLERNGDGTPNFGKDGIKLLTATDSANSVSRAQLRDSIKELFSGQHETVLFYFAGHGHIESTGGYLLASDAKSGDEGIPLNEIVTFANQSLSQNRIIVLDSCHSGIVATSPLAQGVAEIKTGTTILTASTETQYASEKNGAGIFTTLFVDALSGGAGNLVGDVTPGSVYAHIDQSLGPWEQRPVFKTNVERFVTLRKVHPPVALSELQLIARLFPAPGHKFQLDPTYEPERSAMDAHLPAPDPTNTAQFMVLQKYNRVGLVVPIEAPHMWHAAMWSKSCKLTMLGEHYRRLVDQGRI